MFYTKVATFLILIYLCCQSASAQLPITKSSTFGGTGDDRIVKLLPNSNGGFTGVGYSTSAIDGNHGDYDCWFFNLDENYVPLVERVYGTVNRDEVTDVIALSNNRWLMIAAIDTMDGEVSTHFGEVDAWLSILDGDGNLLWEQTLGGEGTDMLLKAATNENNDIFLIGETNSDSLSLFGGSDIWVVKLDAAGNLIWQQSYGTPQNDYGGDLFYDQTNNELVLTGTTVPEVDAPKDFWIAKVNPENGELTQSYIGGENKADVPIRLLALPDNEFALVGETFSDGQAGNGDCFLAVINADFTDSEFYYYGGTAFDGPKDAIFTKSGTIAIIGETFSFDGDIPFGYLLVDTWFLEVETNGQLKNSMVYGGNKFDSGFSILETNNDQFVIGGYTDSFDGDLAMKQHGNHFAWVFEISTWLTSVSPNVNFSKKWNLSNNRLVRNNGATQAYLQIFDMMGKEVFSLNTETALFVIPNLPKGLYQIMVSEKDAKYHFTFLSKH